LHNFQTAFDNQSSSLLSVPLSPFIPSPCSKATALNEVKGRAKLGKQKDQKDAGKSF